MTLFTDLNLYISDKFDGLFPFFRGLPYLRFDLQDVVVEAGTSPAYFDEVLRRMALVQQVTIDPDDDIIMHYITVLRKRRKLRLSNYLFKQFDLNTVAYQFERKPIWKSRGYKPLQILFEDKAYNINFSGIFTGIAHHDFAIEPRIEGEMRIINKTKNTIIHMYDDRGCDIVSKDINLLKDYYFKLNDLILEYNRTEIVQRLGI